jgi:hypothetical protein
VPSEGKLYGKKWGAKRTGSGTTLQGWDEMSGNRGNMGMYSNGSYCTHWNFSNAGSNTEFSVIPNRGGANNTIAFSNMDNMFGWFGQTEANHHFGKCGNKNNATAAEQAAYSDFSFDNKTCLCARLYPHSFNNGEGRYLQWFVK